MRILVVSDSHGDVNRLRLAIEQQPTAQLIIYLGDGLRDLDSIQIKTPLIKVKGNCDLASLEAIKFVERVCGNQIIYCTHGHAEHVKHTTSELIREAKSVNADIALYGHTHNPVTTYQDGLWLVNPGSVKQGRYAVVDVVENGILPILMKIKY